VQVALAIGGLVEVDDGLGSSTCTVGTKRPSSTSTNPTREAARPASSLEA
jgi:hypothetical protein